MLTLTPQYVLVLLERIEAADLESDDSEFNDISDLPPGMPADFVPLLSQNMLPQRVWEDLVLVATAVLPFGPPDKLGAILAGGSDQYPLADFLQETRELMEAFLSA